MIIGRDVPVIVVIYRAVLTEGTVVIRTAVARVPAIAKGSILLEELRVAELVLLFGYTNLTYIVRTYIVRTAFLI